MEVDVEARKTHFCSRLHHGMSGGKLYAVIHPQSERFGKASGSLDEGLGYFDDRPGRPICREDSLGCREGVACVGCFAFLARKAGPHDAARCQVISRRGEFVHSGTFGLVQVKLE